MPASAAKATLRGCLHPLAVALLLAVPIAGEDAQSKFFTTSDGLKVHYLELGAKGTPVVLIHGYTANAEGKWIKSGIAPALAARHRVIAIDARGHGKSDKPHDPASYGPRMAADREIDLTRVKVPVLALVGSLDRPNARTHRLKRELPGAEIVILPGETHGSVHLNPAYTSTLVKFIDAHDH